jgi:hypothetical protein
VWRELSLIPWRTMQPRRSPCHCSLCSLSCACPLCSCCCNHETRPSSTVFLDPSVPADMILFTMGMSTVTIEVLYAPAFSIQPEGPSNLQVTGDRTRYLFKMQANCFHESQRHTPISSPIATCVVRNIHQHCGIHSFTAATDSFSFGGTLLSERSAARFR